MSASISTDVVAALRKATRALHMQVEREMPLSDASAGPDELAAHLAVTLRWLRNLALVVAPYHDGPQDPAELPPVDRLKHLEADLEVLSNIETGIPHNGTESEGSPEIASAAFRWGVAYVVEGSQLGGLVLERQLSASVPAFQLPRRYLGGSGTNVRVRWRQFLRLLRREVERPEDIEAACRGALWAFELIRQMAAEHSQWKAAHPK